MFIVVTAPISRQFLKKISTDFHFPSWLKDSHKLFIAVAKRNRSGTLNNRTIQVLIQVKINGVSYKIKRLSNQSDSLLSRNVSSIPVN